MLQILKRLFSPSTLATRSHGLTDRGMVRENNEDGFGIMDGANVFVVADGMGGHNGGEVASRLAIEALIASLERESAKHLHGNPTAIRHTLTHGFELANDTVRRRAEEDPELFGMGCTLVCALVDGHTLHCCHVGDARCYLYTPGEGLKAITTDHTTLVQYQMALESEETMPELPPRNVVTRVIGYPFPEPPEYNAAPLKPGCRIILCSDGLWSMVDDNEIMEIIAGASSPEEACKELVSRANAAGGTDNITALTVFV